MNKQPELKVDKFGNKRWFLNGELHREDGHAIEYLDGIKAWYLNGVYHREDGPALIYPKNSLQHWYQHGKLHRENGPAVEHVNGSREWWFNGKLHRVNGPACEYIHDKLYFLNNIEFTQEEWFKNLTSEQQYNYLWNLDE